MLFSLKHATRVDVTLTQSVLKDTLSSCWNGVRDTNVIPSTFVSSFPLPESCQPSSRRITDDEACKSAKLCFMPLPLRSFSWLPPDDFVICPIVRMLPLDTILAFISKWIKLVVNVLGLLGESEGILWGNASEISGEILERRPFVVVHFPTV